MKTVWLSILFFINGTGFSQNRILYKASDITDTYKNDITRIRTPWGNHGRFLLAIKNNGSKIKIRKKELWGFQNNKNKMLRFCQGNIFEVVDTTSFLVIYKTFSPKPVYYFSATIESKTYPIGKRKMLKVFGEDIYLEICKKNRLVQQLL